MGKPPLGFDIRFGGCATTIYRSRLDVKDSRAVLRCRVHRSNLRPAEILDMTLPGAQAL